MDKNYWTHHFVWVLAQLNIPDLRPGQYWDLVQLLRR